MRMAVPGPGTIAVQKRNRRQPIGEASPWTDPSRSGPAGSCAPRRGHPGEWPSRAVVAVAAVVATAAGAAAADVAAGTETPFETEAGPAGGAGETAELGPLRESASHLTALVSWGNGDDPPLVPFLSCSSSSVSCCRSKYSSKRVAAVALRCGCDALIFWLRRGGMADCFVLVRRRN